MLILISIILLFYLAFGYYRRRYISPLASVPLAKTDQFWIKYFGLVPPPNESETADHLSAFLIQTAREHPTLAVTWSLFAKPLVIVNSLRGIRNVLIDSKSKDKIPNVQRGNLIRLIQNLVFGGENINNSIGDEWRWRRHVLLPPFQPKQLGPKLLPYVLERVDELMEEFGQCADSGTPLELDEVFMDVTMDVINFYLYGTIDLNYDIVGGRKNLKNEHRQLGLGFQSVEAWLPFGLNKTSWAQRVYRPSRNKLKRFIADSLDRAFRGYEKQRAEFEERGVPEKERAYDSVAAQAFASGQYPPGRFELINDFLSLTFAGYDTTAHTLSFAFGELALNRELQDEIEDEVERVMGTGEITTDRLSQLAIVTATYREALRKYPAVVFIPVHVNRTIQVDGQVVPAGSEIWCNVRGIQMNPEVFPDPERFWPGRFLDSSDPQAAFPDLAFTLGQHACVGRNLAVLELRSIIAITMTRFRCRLKEDCVIDTQVTLTTHPRHGVWVYFERK